MDLPLSKSQIEKLGARLARDPQPSPEDLRALHELLVVYGDVLADAVTRVRLGLAVRPTARIKNTGTILEKLGRHGGSWLKSIQDLAGMRIVGDFDRGGQDQLVNRIVEVFRDEARPPKVIDRRAHPSHGYRAVHVVAFPDGIPVEIQVRTRWQHEWAELFEKLADRVGRDIRYGAPPRHWMTATDRQECAESDLYDAEYKRRRIAVDLARAVADVIAAFELLELAQAPLLELEPERLLVIGCLEDLHDRLDALREP
jgi:hypothetical protein